MQCGTLQHVDLQHTPDKLGNVFIFVIIIVTIANTILAVSPVATPGIIHSISS
jgi:hypothetical protein